MILHSTKLSLVSTHSGYNKEFPGGYPIELGLSQLEDGLAFYIDTPEEAVTILVNPEDLEQLSSMLFALSEYAFKFTKTEGI